MDLEGQEKSRKSAEEIVKAIFEVLPVRSLKMIHHIAEEIGCKWTTVDDYLHLIQYIQDQPRVVSVKIGTRRYGWRRERAK